MNGQKKNFRTIGIVAAILVIAIAAVAMIISGMGTEKDKMPNFIGKTKEDAIETLKQYDFHVKYEYVDSEYAEGVVCGQSIKEYEMVKADSDLTLTVSKGLPKPSVTPLPSPTDIPLPTEEPVPTPTEKPLPTPTEKPAPTPTEKPAPTPTEKPAPTPTEKPVPTPTWSEWTSDSTLAGNPGYETETKEVPQYCYRDKEETTSDKESLSGWTLLPDKTEWKWSSYGDWSNWSETFVDKTNERDVEEKSQYRYRDMLTTTSDQSVLAGWTYSGFTETWSPYGNWSDWSETFVDKTDEREVEEKTQYQYRDKETTTSNSNNMPGWELYDTTSDWGAWSEWTTTSLTAGSADEEVETKQEEISTAKTVYRYSNYYWMDASAVFRKTSYSLMESKGGYTYNKTLSGDDYEYSGVYTGSGVSKRTTKKYNVKYSPDYDTPLSYSQGNGWTDTNGEVWWTETPEEVTETTTVTYYRKRTKVYTYHFYRWGNWSAWTDSVIAATNDREVNPRTVYRYRTRSKTSTYSFWKWDGWSEWSDAKVSEDDGTRQAEDRTVYRYRTREKLYTYYFEKWSDWSNWSETEPESRENREIETGSVTYYRYRLKQ